MLTRSCLRDASRPLIAVLFAALVARPGAAHAAPTHYIAHLNAAAATPPNPSPGTAVASVDVDPVAHTLHVNIVFSSLLSSNTASHIHAATLTPGTGTSEAATVVPTFTGFPGGVTAGTYDHTFDTTLTTSFNDVFVEEYGGTAAGAEAALFQALADGKAYWNIHTTLYPGGEIRGFFALDSTTPVRAATWGRIKSWFR